MTEAHYLSMLVIGVGSFFCGIFPVWFSLKVTRSYPLFLSFVLCFGAGVLISTSLVHMLTEVQGKLKTYSQLYFCGGFLLLFALDEITHYFLENKSSEILSNQSVSGIDSEKRYENRTQQEITDSGATQDDSHPSERTCLLESTKKREHENFHTHSDSELECRCRLEDYSCYCIISRKELKADVNALESRALHSEDHQPCSSNPMAKAGLLIALLTHSILEGVSIGVQTEASQIYLILGAVSFHKVVLSFCLGLELLSNRYKSFMILIAIFLFSIGSPFGILIGMSISSSNGIFAVDAQLQAVAAGSLLFVAAFEVLPRERFKWQHKTSQKAVGIFQLVFFLVGFSIITALHLFVAPLHEHEMFNITVNPIG